MDFTYFVAGLLGLVAGFGVGVVTPLDGRWLRRSLAGAFVTALLLDAVLLINWRAVGSLPPGFLALDLGVIALFTVVGCLMGAAPPLFVRWIWRTVSRQQR